MSITSTPRPATRGSSDDLEESATVAPVTRAAVAGDGEGEAAADSTGEGDEAALTAGDGDGLGGAVGAGAGFGFTE